MVIKEAVAEIRDRGFCVLRGRFAPSEIARCRDAFAPTLLEYLERNREQPNRGPHRHFLPMPFEPPCFQPQFFFDDQVLSRVRGVMDDRVVADQWGCDVPLAGSIHQQPHVDYQRPLFAEEPDMTLPPYLLIVSFGLVDITPANGPIEIAASTHSLPRSEAMRAAQQGEIPLHPVLLNIGDVLIRHPWAIHRGTPNTTGAPRPLLTIRYVRRWYADFSREVNPIPQKVWESLTPEQRSTLRFPIDA